MYEKHQCFHAIQIVLHHKQSEFQVIFLLFLIHNINFENNQQIQTAKIFTLKVRCTPGEVFLFATKVFKMLKRISALLNLSIKTIWNK